MTFVLLNIIRLPCGRYSGKDVKTSSLTSPRRYIKSLDSASFFGFPKDMFREACLRLEPTFFRFMKERPCYVLPDKDTGAINGLIQATTAIYNDRENRFRNQIAKNHLQSLMLDIYDQCYRYFDKQEIEGGSRQDEIFKKFVALVHENCISQREVNFYANELCISTKYLTGICRSV